MTYIFLPALGDDVPAASGSETEWTSFPQGRQHLIDFANALEMPVEHLRAERIKSTPSPWARLLVFESALFDESHPAHEQIVGEWRGLLTVIGLAKYLRLTVTHSGVDLTRDDELLTNLRRLRPLDSGALLDRITLVHLAGSLSPVGATSPRTVVFTGIRPIQDPGVPFYDSSAGRLTDPTACYLRVGDGEPLQMIDAWLRHTLTRLRAAVPVLQTPIGQFQPTGTAPGATRVSHLVTLFEQWQANTTSALAKLSRRDPPTGIAFKDSGLDRGGPDQSVAQLYRVITVLTPPEISDVDAAQAHPFRMRRTGKAVIDPTGGIVQSAQGEFSGRLRLPRGQVREISDGVIDRPLDQDADSVVPVVRFTNIWTRELIEVVGAVPSAAVVLSADRNGKRRDYLYPFDSRILEFASVDQIKQWTTIQSDDSGGLTVSFQVPVGSDLTIEFRRTYGDEDRPVLDAYNAPDVVVWPNFESVDWKVYLYSTYQRARRDTLIAAPVSKPVLFAESDGKQWGSLDAYPRVWRAHDDASPAIGGLFFVSGPEPLKAASGHLEEWHLSIDFGSTQTRVFRRVGADTESIEEVVIAPRARMIFGTPEHLQYIFLPSHEERGPRERGVPSLVWLPLLSAVRRDTGWLPSDGHVFTGLELGDPQDGRVLGNLKWRHSGDEEATTFENFVKHVVSAVAAEAALKGAKVVSVRTAYPSVLPGWLQSQHEQAWSRLAQRFGIQFDPPASEARAVASFLIGAKKAPAAANLLAVDVGGSTADFAVWRGQRAHFDSIKVAGNIFNQVVAYDASARAAIGAAAKAVLGSEFFGWLPPEDVRRNAIIAGLVLRKLSRQQGNGVLEFGRRLYDGPGSPGARILAHTAYAYAIIGFTLGLLTRHAEIDDDNYHVYFAGRGSILLRWLDAMAAGLSKSWFADFFLRGRAAAGGNQVATVNITHPDTDLKDEVGIGLLIGDARLQPRPRLTPAAGTATISGTSAMVAPPDLRDQLHVTFVGETCYRTADGRALRWDEELYPTMLPSIDSGARAELGKMDFLNAFLQGFEATLAGQLVADCLGLRSALEGNNLRDMIHQRVFGSFDADRIRKDRTAATNLMIEPFFVTEAKVVLEQATQNSNVFSS